MTQPGVLRYREIRAPDRSDQPDGNGGGRDRDRDQEREDRGQDHQRSRATMALVTLLAAAMVEARIDQVRHRPPPANQVPQISLPMPARSGPDFGEAVED
jgi:hypothetical protein